jgi:FtsH-binding integral membrane protein
MADTPIFPAELTPTSVSSTPDDAGETQRFMQQVYGWMAFALVVSGGTAYYVVHDANLLNWIFEK